MRRTADAIDCDVHPEAPPLSALLQYIGSYWREAFAVRGIDKLDVSLTSDLVSSPTQFGKAEPSTRSPLNSPFSSTVWVPNQPLPPAMAAWFSSAVPWPRALGANFGIVESVKTSMT